MRDRRSVRQAHGTGEPQRVSVPDEGARETERIRLPANDAPIVQDVCFGFVSGAKSFLGRNNALVSCLSHALRQGTETGAMCVSIITHDYQRYRTGSVA